MSQCCFIVFQIEISDGAAALGRALFDNPIWTYFDSVKHSQPQQDTHHHWYDVEQVLRRQKRDRKREEEEKKRRERTRREVEGSITVIRDPTVPPNTLIFPESGERIEIDEKTAEVANMLFGRQNDHIWNGLETITDTAKFPMTCSIQ